MKIPFKAFLLGSIFCIIFSYVATVSINRSNYALPANQVSSLSFLFICFIAIAFNPTLKLLRIKPLSLLELSIVIIMAVVPAGLPVFGFVSEFVPIAGELNNPQSRTKKHGTYINPNVRSEYFIQSDSKEFWENHNQGIRINNQEAFPIFLPKDERFDEYFDDLIQYFFKGNPQKRSFWGEIPWQQWAQPIIYWSIFLIICLILFYSLNELLFKQWFENEKLVFPHAELLTTLVENDQKSIIPKVFRTHAFWIGFGVSFTIMLYNGAANIGWIPGVQPVDLKNDLRPYLQDTFLEGLIYNFSLSIFFVVIGLAYLLPAEISFSIWFFFLFVKFQQLTAVHMGYGENSNSFRSDMLSTTSFMSAQGGGAMVVFGLICLWKIRHQTLSFLYKLTAPKGFKNYSAEDIKQHTWPSLTFFISSIAFIYMFYWSKVDLSTSILIYFLILIMTITLVRLVSEGGLIGFQIHYGPFHVLRTFGLFNTPLFSLKSFAPALPLYSSLFLDVKTFIAPTMMTAKNIAHRSKIPLKLFPIILFTGFALTLAISICTSLALLYDMGVGNMNSWFFNGLPNQYVFKNINVLLDNPEGTASFSTSQVIWTGVGGLCMGGILYCRTFLFWFPHPIGLLMYLNPLVRAYWFSFFLAWLFKSYAVKYCRPSTNQQLKYAFIGLILGELFIVALSTFVALADMGNMGITLNR